MANKGMVIGGSILLVLGILLLIVSIMIYEINLKNRKSQSLLVYALMITSVFMSVIGGVLLAFGLYHKSYTVQ